jgi:chitodextrinase
VWTHLAGTYDGTSAKLYVNGVQVATLPVTGSLTTSSNPLEIGGDGIFGQFFRGLIDEVRVYNQALTLAQIRTDMTATILAPSGDTIAPTAPGDLAATATGPARINLAWPASTDNVGVAKYFVERCQGAGCSDFSYIAIATGASYSDGTVSATTTYSYRVRATDAQGNLSPYSNTASATTSGFPASGLVAAYGFNEGSGSTINDASGNGNSGTIVGTVSWSAQGKFGAALSFNGATRVDIPTSGLLNLTTAMTLSAWVRPSSTPTLWRDVIYKGNDNYFLMASSDNNAPAVGGTWPGSHQYASAATGLAVNTWTHLAATYDGTAARLYVNGVQAASFAMSGNLVTSFHPLQIGGDSIFGQFFQGLIDEVRVYNRALTQTEIQADMGTPVTGTDTSAPTAPTNLSATAMSAAQINLSWSASTDNVGVTGYRVERCQGAGCGNFAQIATPTLTSFGDTGLSAGTSYSYRVRANDAAGNLSGYSNVASATTATAQGQMFFIHPDHLNTPRMIANRGIPLEL